MYKVIEKQKPMKTRKALRDMSNWQLIGVGGEFGTNFSELRVCPICLHYHEVNSLKVKERMNKIEDKIEEILNKYTNSPLAFDDSVERVTFQERYFPVSDLVKELSTLIQESNEEAIKRYHAYITTSNGEFQEMSASDSARVLEEYLSSIGKEEE